MRLASSHAFDRDAAANVAPGVPIKIALADAVQVARTEVKMLLIGKKWGRPLVCNDGVTIAKPTTPEQFIAATEVVLRANSGL